MCIISLRRRTWVVTFGYNTTLSKVALKALRLETRLTPQEAFARIQRRFDYVFLLESAKGPKRLAEYSFIGFDPSTIVTIKDSSLTLVNTESGESIKKRVTDPLEELRKI